MEKKKRTLRDYLNKNRTWSSANPASQWTTQRPSYSGHRPYRAQDNQSAWRQGTKSYTSSTFNTPTTTSKTPNTNSSVDQNETRDEKLTRGALGATPRSQELLADYRTLQGQLDFTEQENDIAFSRDMYKTQELAEAQRIKDRIAMYSAGVGSSGLASQAIQDLANRKWRSQNDLKARNQAQERLLANQRELKEKEVWAKMMADESFKKNITPKPVGNEDNSIPLDASIFDELKKTYPKAKDRDIAQKMVKDTLLDSIKDEKKRNEFLAKYENNYDELVKPFKVPGAKVEMSINKRNGAIAYYNKKTGVTTVVDFRKDTSGNWVLDNQRSQGIENNTLAAAYSQSDRILRDLRKNLSSPQYGGGANIDRDIANSSSQYIRDNYVPGISSTALTKAERDIISNPNTNRSIIDQAIKKYSEDAYKSYTINNNVATLTAANNAIKALAQSSEGNLYLVIKGLKSLIADRRA